MKKFFAIFLLIFFSLNIFTTSFVSAETNRGEIIKNLIISKTKLKEFKKGNAYIKAIDSFIEKTDIKNLEKVNERINILSKQKIKLSSEVLYLIKYLKYSIEYKLAKKDTIKPETEAKIIKKETKAENINSSEKEKIKTEILKLQKNLLDKGETLLVKVRKNIEENYNIEENGDIEMKFKFDYKDFANVDYKLLLKDYLAKTNSDFDNSFKGELKSFLNYNINGKNNGQLDLSTYIEQISKGGDYYIKLKNFHISNESGMEDIKEFLDIVKKMEEEDKFVKIINNDNVKKVLNYIKDINPKNFLEKSKKFETQPLLEAYGKDGDKYLLKPTKFACEKYKEIENIFDPFNGVKCSESQYQKMLEEIKDLGGLYMTFNGNKTKIGLDLEGESGKMNFYIIYNLDKIKEINFYTKQKSNLLKGEYIKFNYLDGTNLNLNYMIDGNNINLNSKLDSNNKFTNIDFNFKDKKNKNIATLKLENNNITGNFNFIKTGYDYSNQDWKEIDKYNLKGNITGKTTNDNSIDNLTISYILKDLVKNKENLNGNFTLKKDFVGFNIDYQDEGNKVKFELNSNFDENYLPINGKLKLDILRKDGKFDYKTYKYNYNGDYKEVFKTDLKVSEREIIGKTKVFDYFNIDHSGWISNERFELNNSFRAEKKILEEMNNFNKSINSEAEKIENLNGNFNIKSEFTNNNNDIIINSFINLNNKEILKFELKKDATISKKQDKIFIEAPTNYTNFENLIK